MGKTLFIAEKSKVANEIMKSPRFRHSQKYIGSKPYYGYYEMIIILSVGAVDICWN